MDTNELTIIEANYQSWCATCCEHIEIGDPIIKLPRVQRSAKRIGYKFRALSYIHARCLKVAA